MCTGPGAPGGYPDRCGYGPRLPLLVISPYTRSNYVDHNVTDQTSIIKFIEDNWLGGHIGGGSFDTVAGRLDARGGVLDFHTRTNDARILLDPTTGEIVSRIH